jgi:hypothetical protein
MDYSPARDNIAAEILGCYDTPAYVRRGLQLAEARDRLFNRCQTVRDDYLCGVVGQLRLLRSTICDWNELSGYMASDRDCQVLARFETAFLVRTATSGSGKLTDSTQRGEKRRTGMPLLLVSRRWELHALASSIERFNRRWSAFVETVDLDDVNRQVADYNRYYLLEKECALRSARLAARGFVPARPVTRADLAARYPLLDEIHF